jgi:hypothetical protein
MDGNKLSLNECYQILNLDQESASLENIEKNYYKLVGEKLQAGKKTEIVNLKQAYWQLVGYYQNQQQVEAKARDKNTENYLNTYFKHHLNNVPFQVEIKYVFPNLTIKINNSKIKHKSATIKLLSDLLLANLTIKINQVKFIGYNNQNKIIWQEEIHFVPDNKEQILICKNTNLLLAEAERKTNIFALPISFFLAFAISLIEPLAWFISIWIHELGHASIAWFSGYQAMVTLAGTVTKLERSLFVYYGILFLLGLTFYSAKKEGKKAVIIITIILAIIQFILTWVISRSTYKMLLTFAGIGGEFYLSTLLIIAFYWQFLEKFYWDFWRFFALIIGTTTFVSSWLKWHRIKLGTEQIPWGTFWGGRGDSGGDLNILNYDYGWSINQIISTYHHLSNFCLLIIIAVYLYFCFKSNPSWGWKIRRFFANYSYLK